ncbi:RluA family pseudouridine synthase [Aureliella helgolandensis]|uniref:Ribosomal large subunit pseudouridine synthase A n=1 Tax=Aureliella helgolandensis TaxID=2527968 RepID=A0A518G2Q6_9BACT|nr:RluA family pseudouridine synthase [Aureliella helgolandensis]QDV22829.1 Ribosomal large subunit pseudouridine synthase A [Aureliella helgolandensis]
MNEPIQILHEESHFMLINKPAGLFSQAAPGVPSLETCLTSQIKQRDEHHGQPFIGLPHRLDRATSGIMLIARNQRSLARFGQQFQSRKVGKYYLAVVQGMLPVGVYEWEDYLRKIPNEPQAEVALATASGARQAKLTAQVIATTATQSLLLIHLSTGRMHQIRVQAASRGFPVLGDALYSNSATGEVLATDTSGRVTQLSQSTPAEEPSSTVTYPSAVPIGLHALRIEFRHPKTALQCCATAELPERWQAWAANFAEPLREVCQRSRRDERQAWKFPLEL